MRAAPLIIFDCDGVLVDSESIASDVFSRHLCALGLDYSAARCRAEFTGLSLAACLLQIERDANVCLPDDFLLHLQRDTMAAFARDLQRVAGVVDVLEFLDRQGIPYCVASSGSHDKMQFTLTHTGLFERLKDRLYSASEVARGKPAPDLFLHAANQQGHEARYCIVVEDAAPGIQAGLAAGMTVCAFGEQHAAAANTIAFTNMSELPSILAALIAPSRLANPLIEK
jgi:HAD superfamily hydrolase (TIGR01509 family)